MMIKSSVLNELNAAIETQTYVQNINRKAHRNLGYDLSTLYMLFRLREAPSGVEITELAEELNLSASALSLRISNNVRLGLMYVKNVAHDRRTKRAFITNNGAQAVRCISAEVEQLLSKNH